MFGGYAEGQRRRDCGQPVVHVVQAGHFQRQLQIARGAAEGQLAVVGAVQGHASGDHIGVGAFQPALRTAPVAQMPQQDEPVLQAAVTARARDRVGGVGQRVEGVGRVGDAEGTHTSTQAGGVCQRGDGRVVGVEHHGRSGGQGGQGLAPPVVHRVYLAVAVELVAEQIVEQSHARAHSPQHAGRGGLVHLEQAHPEPVGQVACGFGRVHHCRHQPPLQIGA